LIKTMIVDDEFHIREGIKTTIPWSEIGLELAAEAESGLAAWNQYNKYLPDIVLLDINIPELNGIELAHRIRERGDLTQIIFMTGYDDFKLVKEAVVIGASDYLLKPVGYDELMNALHKAIQTIDEKRKQTTIFHTLTKKVDEYGKAAADRIFLEMLQQQTPLKASIEHLRTNDVELRENAQYVIINAEVVHYDSFMSQVSSRDRGLYIYAYRKLAQEVLSEIGNGWVLLEKPNQVLIIWEIDAEHGPGHTYYAKQFQNIVLSYLKMRVSIGLSNIVSGLRELPLAYQQSKDALKHVYLLGEGHIIPYNVIEPNPSVGNKIVGKEISLLTELRHGNESNVSALLEQWCSELKLLPWEEAKLAASQVIVFVLRILSEVHIKNQEVAQLQPLVELEHASDLDSLLSFLNGYLSRVATAIGQNKVTPSLKVIEQAKSWIRLHMEDEVSLTKLAEHIHLNANYLSQLFKQTTGETFIDFVTRERIEKAKELLQDPKMKIFEVATLVGFKDSNYFSIAFKNKLGFTPSEYRQRLI
jgi:two-component system response regulator YesN